MGDVMREAALKQAEAKFAMGDFNSFVIENAAKAQFKVIAKKDNIAGLLSRSNCCTSVGLHHSPPAAITKLTKRILLNSHKFGHTASLMIE